MPSHVSLIHHITTRIPLLRRKENRASRVGFPKALLLAITCLSGFGGLRTEAIIIALHNEDNSPVLSGWTSTGGLNNFETRFEKIAGVGAVTINDLGANPGSTRGYEIVPGIEERDLGETFGWKFTTRILLPEPSNAVGASVYTEYAMGSKRWGLSFGTNSAANPIISTYDGDTFTLSGARGTFHDYVVQKGPGAVNPELLIDGEVFDSNYAGQNTALRRFIWGSYSSADMGEGSYQRVMLEIFPPLENYFIEHYPLDGNATDALSTTTNTTTGVSTVADRNGNNPGALLFDSEDDRVTLNNSNFAPDRRFTITAWVRPDDAIPGQLRRILSKWDGSFAGFEKGAIVLETYTGRIGQDLRARFTIYKENERPVTITSNQVLNTGSWYHLAARIVNGHMELFINGESAGRASMEAESIEPTDFLWGIGCDGSGESTSGENFRGAIDDLRFYNQALSDHEIVDIFEEGTFQVASTSVEPGATGVDPDSDIAVKFPEALDTSTALAENVSVHGSLSGPIQATISAAFDTLAISPVAPLKQGELVEVSLGEGILAADGKSLLPYTFSFETTVPEIESIYARDTRSRSASLAGVLVDTAVGAFQQEFNTLKVESVRQLDLKLRYNSMLDRDKGAFGYGWTHPFEARLVFEENGNVTAYYDLSRCNTFYPTETPGLYRSADESAQFDKLEQKAGKFPYQQSDNWILTRKSGETFVFDPQGRIVARANRIFQFFEAIYEDTILEGILDPASGRKILFNYDYDTGLIQSAFDVQSASDFPYRHVFFEYDEFCRLTAIHEPVFADERTAGEVFNSLAIPDNDPEGLVHEIFVESEDPVGIVTLDTAIITHGRHLDLEVTLQSPSGTTAMVFNQEPGAGPLEFRDVRLFDFNGENPAGLWKVIVKDLRPGEFGTLDRWRLQFSAPSNPVYFTYPDEDFSGSGSARILASLDMIGEPFFSVEYDGQRRVIKQDDGIDSNEVATFSYNFTDPNRRITTYKDRVGESWILEHDSMLRILSSTTPIGATTSWNYTERGQVESVINPLGQVNAFTWDENGYLSSSTDSSGDITLFNHDLYGNLLSITDSLGHETEFQYNTSERTIRKVRDAKDGETDKRYGANNQITENIIEDGGGIDYDWNAGLLQSAQHMQQNSRSELSYDPAGRPLVIRDGDGFETHIRYRANGDILEREDPQGAVRRTVYDHRSRVVEEIDRKGKSTLFAYDGNDNLIKITDTEGRESFINYDGEDRLLSEIDEEGRSLSYAYDGAGRQISITNAMDQTTTIHYDRLGNQTGIIDFKGLAVQKTVYDKRNMPVSITGPYGNTTKLEYDALGRQTSVTDAAGRKTQYEYDELDRLIQVTDPLGRVFKQEYHADDLISAIEEPQGERTRLSYDQANRPNSTEYWFYSTTPNNYNARDLITRFTLPGLDRFTLDYDDNGRVTKISEFRNTNFNDPVRARRYEYDANDNVTRVGRVIPNSLSYEAFSTRTYDTKNRVTSYTNAEAETIGYAYNEQGSLDRVTYPDGKTVEYFYDGQNRLQRVLDWADRETFYEYNTLSLVEKITFPNGATRIMDYDEAGRVLERTDFDVNQTVIVQYAYSYDESSNLMVESLGHAVPPYQPENVTMTYSRGNRLETYNGIPVSIDTRGNTTSGPLNGVEASFEHDVRGNMTKAGEVDYFYDFEDRLQGWDDGSGETRFTTNPVPGLSQILVKTAPGNAVTRYVYGIGLLYEDTPDGLRVFHYDERGNTVALSDASGQVAGTIAYGPYGEVYNRTGSTDTIFLQNGLFGVVTGPQGLCYMRYRWYSPEIKRFLRQDAHYGSITQTGTLNRFAYAGGNPIARIDPEGEFWHIAAGAAVGALVSVTVELVVDLADGNGIDHSLGDYAAAAIGGAVTGGLIAYNPAFIVGAEMAGAATTNLLASYFNNEPVDYTSLATDVALAAAFGKAGAGGRGGSRLAQKAGKTGKKRLVAKFFTPDSSQYKTIVRNVRPKNITPRSVIARNFGTDAGTFLKDFGLDVALGTLQTYIGKGLEFTIDYSIANPEIFAHPEIIMDPRYQSVDSTSTAGNFGTLYGAQTEQLGGRRGVFGEFNHWKIYTGSLLLAREPVPVENSQQLNTF